MYLELLWVSIRCVESAKNYHNTPHNCSKRSTRPVHLPMYASYAMGRPSYCFGRTIKKLYLSQRTLGQSAVCLKMEYRHFNACARMARVTGVRKINNAQKMPFYFYSNRVLIGSQDFYFAELDIKDLLKKS